MYPLPEHRLELASPSTRLEADAYVAGVLDSVIADREKAQLASTGSPEHAKDTVPLKLALGVRVSM